MIRYKKASLDDDDDLSIAVESRIMFNAYSKTDSVSAPMRMLGYSTKIKTLESPAIHEMGVSP